MAKILIKNCRNGCFLKKLWPKLQYVLVPCKRRSSVNSGAWLRRFDDITGVEKSWAAEAKKGKKWRKNVVSLQLNMRFPKTWNAWKFAMFKDLYIHNCWNIFFGPEPLWNSDNQKLSKFKTDFFCSSVIIPFAVQLFLLQLSSHCSTQNIGFSDSGYAIKPPQPSFAIYGAPPFTGHQCFYYGNLYNHRELKMLRRHYLFAEKI